MSRCESCATRRDSSMSANSNFPSGWHRPTSRRPRANRSVAKARRTSCRSSWPSRSSGWKTSSSGCAGRLKRPSRASRCCPNDSTMRLARSSSKTSRGPWKPPSFPCAADCRTTLASRSAWRAAASASCAKESSGPRKACSATMPRPCVAPAMNSSDWLAT